MRWRAKWFIKIIGRNLTMHSGIVRCGEAIHVSWPPRDKFMESCEHLFEICINELHQCFLVNGKHNLDVGGIHYGCLNHIYKTLSKPKIKHVQYNSPFANTNNNVVFFLTAKIKFRQWVKHVEPVNLKALSIRNFGWTAYPKQFLNIPVWDVDANESNKVYVCRKNIMYTLV